MISEPDLLTALKARRTGSKQLSEFLAASDLAAFEFAYGPWHGAWTEVRDEVPPCITHGDPCANNFFWQGDQVSSIIDFHLCGLATPALDLAIGIDRTCFHWLDILEGDHDAVSVDDSRRLLTGYEQVRPLPEAERAAARALLALHRLEFAFSLMDYYLTFEGSRKKAEWCRDVYILLHAEYLHSDRGQQKVDAIFAT